MILVPIVPSLTRVRIGDELDFALDQHSGRKLLLHLVVAVLPMGAVPRATDLQPELQASWEGDSCPSIGVLFSEVYPEQQFTLHCLN